MSVTKADIARSISSRYGLRKARAEHLVQFVLEFIKVSLESGEDVLLSGFRRFSVEAIRSRLS